jgi:molybdopterin/thiamine biosynthesis adenylyltransferase
MWMRPIVKAVRHVRESGDLVLIPNLTDLRRFADPDGEFEEVVRLADGTRTTAEIAASAGRTEAGVRRILARLDEFRLVADADAPSRMSEQDRRRWRNNLGFFDAFAGLHDNPADFQERLAGSHVLQLGVGGIGSMVLMNLAGLGVGEITMVDFDRVEPANFTRQFVYREADNGAVKVARAAEWLSSFNSAVKVHAIERRIDGPADVPPLLDGVDLVVVAIDQPNEAPQWVNQACVRAGIPFVAGGFVFDQGSYQSVWPGHSACLRCREVGDVPEPAAPVNRAIGPTVSLIGGFVALEAVRYLTGFAEPAAAGRLWTVDFGSGRTRMAMQWGRSPECPVCADADENRPATEYTITADTRLNLAHMTVVADGGEFLIGDLALGTFFAIPPVGEVALRALRQGRTVAEATAEASAFAGTDVDVLEFANVLRDKGLVRGVRRDSESPPKSPPPDARPGPLTWLARALLSPAAWVVYAVAAVAGCGVLAFDPGLRPTWESVVFLPDPALSVVLTMITAFVFGAVHEVFHWFGARRFGHPARLRVSRRGLFPVFETDLTRLWAVPRGQRYPAFLAGMAFDGLVTGAALIVRLGYQHGWFAVPPTLDRWLAIVVLTTVVRLVGQTPLFMRTDLYAVLVTALGCRNLYRVSMLILKDRFVGLRRPERAELAAASARDRRIGRWFSLLYLVGVAGLTYLLFGIFLPSGISMITWSALTMLSTSPAMLAFWEALAMAVFLGLELGAPFGMWIWGRLRGRSA